MEGGPPSPYSTTTSHLVQRFRNIHPNEPHTVRPETKPRSASPHSAVSYSIFVDRRSSQASLVTDGSRSTANTRSDVSHNTKSSATSQQSSLPLSSLSAPTTQLQPSSTSLSILPDSTILSSLQPSNPSQDNSMPSSLAGSASPPIY